MEFIDGSQANPFSVAKVNETRDFMKGTGAHSNSNRSGYNSLRSAQGVGATNFNNNSFL